MNRQREDAFLIRMNDILTVSPFYTSIESMIIVLCMHTRLDRVTYACIRYYARLTKNSVYTCACTSRNQAQLYL